jgi:hypothetical protein
MAVSSSEEALRARVEQCYSALQQGDWRKVEKYLTKDSKPLFRSENKKPLTAYQIQSINIESDGRTAWVVVQVHLVSAVLPRPILVPKSSVWRLVNRVWYMSRQTRRAGPMILRLATRKANSPPWWSLCDNPVCMSFRGAAILIGGRRGISHCVENIQSEIPRCARNDRTNPVITQTLVR